MNDLTVIIPLDKWDNTVKEYLERAIDSVINQTVKPGGITIVIPLDFDNVELMDFFKKTEDKLKETEIRFQRHYAEDVTTIPQLINKGVEIHERKYFCVLEYMDAIEETWFKNVQTYIMEDKNINAYVPIVKLFSDEGKFINFQHTPWWALGFVDDALGYFDEESLKLLPDVGGYGTVMKTSDFIEVGKLKPSILYYYWGEFFLRFVYNKKNMFVIPKTLYNHTLIIPEESEEIAKFYWDSIFQEYLYHDERELIIMAKNEN
jgi:hypothetical protein